MDARCLLAFGTAGVIHLLLCVVLAHLTPAQAGSMAADRPRSKTMVTFIAASPAEQLATRQLASPAAMRVTLCCAASRL
jgi:hypothetical protein